MVACRSHCVKGLQNLSSGLIVFNKHALLMLKISLKRLEKLSMRKHHAQHHFCPHCLHQCTAHLSEINHLCWMMIHHTHHDTFPNLLFTTHILMKKTMMVGPFLFYCLLPQKKKTKQGRRRKKKETKHLC